MYSLHVLHQRKPPGELNLASCWVRLINIYGIELRGISLWPHVIGNAGALYKLSRHLAGRVAQQSFTEKPETRIFRHLFKYIFANSMKIEGRSQVIKLKDSFACTFFFNPRKPQWKERNIKLIILHSHEAPRYKKYNKAGYKGQPIQYLVFRDSVDIKFRMNVLKAYTIRLYKIIVIPTSFWT